MVALPCLLLLLFALPASSQKEIVTIPNWRVHQGDDPAWANEDFDDSEWAVIPYRELNRNGYEGGFHWYRATIQVPADFAGQELAVGIDPLSEVYDVYVNGTPVGHWGSWEPKPQGPFPRHLAFAIPPGLVKGSMAHIAIRRWNGGAGYFWLTFDVSGYFRYPHDPEIGSRLAIETLEQLHPAAGAIEELPWSLSYVIFLFAAAISFVLFSVQRRKPEYFFLGFFCLLSGAPPLIATPMATSNSIMAQSWGPVLTMFLSILRESFSLIFLAYLCPRFKKILLVGAVFCAFFALAAALTVGTQSAAIGTVWTWGRSYCSVIFDLIAVWGLFQDRRRDSFAIATCLMLSAMAFSWANSTPQLQTWAPMLYRPIGIEAGPFRIDIRTVPNILFVFVTLIVLYLRYRDEQARQAAITQDLAAARRMQELLLAGSAEKPAGFAVDAIYRPAREVGGDFYRTVPLEDGSLLVILGDVSGKGLDAAMLVAVILGSLANETHRNPASLLTYLNRAVMGRTGGGFITACCARFYPDGRTVLANAGQISPYVDGQELELAVGLPLGISAEADYTETETMLSGEVTFISDGVVEASNANGELLGFDRMDALTTKPAEEIAETAQQWGQDDDITVVKVMRIAKLAPVPA
jgi:hypothetical protein